MPSPALCDARAPGLRAWNIGVLPYCTAGRPHNGDATMLLSFWLRSLRTALERSATGRKQRTSGRRPRGKARLCVERLEDRTVPTTFTVTNTLGTTAVGSLAWAINQVNADTTDTAAQPDVINFNIT